MGCAWVVHRRFRAFLNARQPRTGGFQEALMAIFSLETDPEGVATITWDLPGRSMNVLTFEGIAELDAAIDAALADPDVKGVVITSAKPDFAGGMDLNLLAEMKNQAGADPAR